MRAAFAYCPGSGLLYRIPCAVKLICLLVTTILLMYAPLSALVYLIFLLAGLARIAGFKAPSQWADLRPALYYGASIFMINIAVNTASVFAGAQSPGAETSPAFLQVASKILKVDPYYALTAIRIITVTQISALLFRTTTAIEIKDTLDAVEVAARRALQKLPFCRKIRQTPLLSLVLSLSLGFVPEIFALHSRLLLAARARGIKGFPRARLTLFSLLGLSLHRASQKALALEARCMRAEN